MGYLIQDKQVKYKILGIQSVLHILLQMSLVQFFIALRMFNEFIHCFYRVAVKFISLAVQLTHKNCSFNSMIFHYFLTLQIFQKTVSY